MFSFVKREELGKAHLRLLVATSASEKAFGSVNVVYHPG